MVERERERERESSVCFFFVVLVGWLVSEALPTTPSSSSSSIKICMGGDGRGLLIAIFCKNTLVCACFLLCSLA